MEGWTPSSQRRPTPAGPPCWSPPPSPCCAAQLTSRQAGSRAGRLCVAPAHTAAASHSASFRTDPGRVVTPEPSPGRHSREPRPAAPAAVLALQITARPVSFATLEGPTRSGFRPYLNESLGAFATGKGRFRAGICNGWVVCGIGLCPPPCASARGLVLCAMCKPLPSSAHCRPRASRSAPV